MLKLAYILSYINKIEFTYPYMSASMGRDKLYQNGFKVNSRPSVPTTKMCAFYIHFCVSSGTSPVVSPNPLIAFH